MLFKFRAKVRILAPQSKILRPDGHVSQGEFFEGAIGTVIRYDPAKEGYLLVMDCPELSALMGENITASFKEYELQALEPDYAQRNPLAMPGPFEYPIEKPQTLTKEQRLKRQERKIASLGNDA
jgi:hypothetical protein